MSRKPAENQRLDLRTELQNRILGILDEIDKGFKKVLMMYYVAFYFGIGLIAFSVGATLVQSDFFYLLFGGAGIADVAAFFIYKPAEDLQRSRGNLAQLNSLFITWLDDQHTLNSYLEIVMNQPNPDIEKIKEIEKKKINHTVILMSAIEIFVAGKKGSKEIEEFLEKLEKTLDL